MGDVKSVSTQTTHFGDIQSVSHIINDCPVNKLSLKVVSQLYTPFPILPESGCPEFIAYAREKKERLENDRGGTPTRDF